MITICATADEDGAVGVGADADAASAGAEEMSARVVAMRDGMRRENATRWCGAIEMEVNEESVAPWKVGRGCEGLAVEDGVVEEKDDVGGERECEGVRLGMKDVTTATGWAISRRSARILWESTHAWFKFLLARSEDDQHFVVEVASASAERDLDMAKHVSGLRC